MAILLICWQPKNSFANIFFHASFFYSFPSIRQLNWQMNMEIHGEKYFQNVGCRLNNMMNLALIRLKICERTIFFSFWGERKQNTKIIMQDKRPKISSINIRIRIRMWMWMYADVLIMIHKFNVIVVDESASNEPPKSHCIKSF